MKYIDGGGGGDTHTGLPGSSLVHLTWEKNGLKKQQHTQTHLSIQSQLNWQKHTSNNMHSYSQLGKFTHREYVPEKLA